LTLSISLCSLPFGERLREIAERERSKEGEGADRDREGERDPRRN